MIVYTGHWEGCLSVAVTPEDEGLFRRLGNLEMDIDGRTVSLMQSDGAGSNRLHALVPERNGGLTVAYVWAINPQPWARWLRQATELDVLDEGLMQWTVAPDHELTWPRINGLGRGGVVAWATREFALRTYSAYHHGGEELLHSMIREVPDDYRSRIPGRTWKRLVTATMEGRIGSWT